MNSLSDGSREYYTSLEAAMESQQIPLEKRPMVRELAARIPYDEIYVPTQSRTYVALVDPESKKMNAAINSGYFEVHERVLDRLDGFTVEGSLDDWKWVLLPVNRVRDGGGSGRRATDDLEPAICASCFTALPATGVCDDCS